MLTTVKGLPPSTAFKVYPQMRAQPFTARGEQVPGTPLATGATDAVGTLAIDLPTWQPLAVVFPTGNTLIIENANTVVASA